MINIQLQISNIQVKKLGNWTLDIVVRLIWNKNENLMRRDTIYDLEERLVNFAVEIIRAAEELPNTKSGNHIAKQLIRSGTSPAPNYGEAQAAESRADFIHKMKLSLKELRETRVWLKILLKAKMTEKIPEIKLLLEESSQLVLIFAASINTAQEKNERQ